MFLRIKRFGPVCLLTTGVAIKPEDYKPSYKDSLTYESLTPWEKVKEIFKFENHKGKVNEDYAWISNNTAMAAVVGATWGFVKHGSRAFQDFIDNNDASKFANPCEAKSRLSSVMTLAALKGSFRLGLKFSVLVGIYTTATTCVSVYRGKTGILEHTLAGLVMGSAYRFNYGLRGMIVGGAAGSIIFTMYGAVTLALFKLCGVDFEQIRRENYNLYTWSDRMERKVQDAANLKDMNPLDKEKLLKTQHLPIGLDVLPDAPAGSS